MRTGGDLIARNLYIADTHFGHKNILHYDNRPFTTVEEMNSEMENRWNMAVEPADTVYILGDFCYKGDWIDILCGCVSEYDIRLMGLPIDEDDTDAVGYQRKNCLCYSGKKELLNSRKPCPHQCLYCFWKDVK